MKTTIKDVYARRVFDSRANPTVCASVLLECGAVGTAMVPSGASTGIYEACEKRDGGSEYCGRDVSAAVHSARTELADAVRGIDAARQLHVDEALIAADGSQDKSRCGANAILAVSLACARAAAQARQLPLYRHLGGIYARVMPRPMMNILNGGAHAGNNVEIQEFMIVPQAKTFCECMRMSSEVYHALGDLLRRKGLSRCVGDEGGYAPDLESDEQALELICDAIASAGYRPGEQIAIALDAAASEWAQGTQYVQPKSGRSFTREELAQYFEKLVHDYPVISIEDPLGQEDFEGFAMLSERLHGVQIVGDDLFVTNTSRLQRGIEHSSANAILIKPNQIGTLTETLDAVNLAQRSGMGVIISHRSGETEDSFIADLAVAVNAGQIKAGAPARSDRTAKYNRLIAIEEEISGEQRC